MLLFDDFRAYPALEGPPWSTFAAPDDRFMARLTHLESTLIEMRASVDGVRTHYAAETKPGRVDRNP
jgi:hypothetical protein